VKGAHRHDKTVPLIVFIGSLAKPPSGKSRQTNQTGNKSFLIAKVSCGFQKVAVYGKMPTLRTLRLPAYLSPFTAFSVERRLLLWFVTSTAFLLVYMYLNVMFVPPPPKPAAKPPGADADADKIAELVQQAPADAVLDDPGPDKNKEQVEKEAAPVPPARLSLGSMDPKSGYFILATLNNQGGTVERIELTERNENGRLKYRRVDTISGYLGHLALAPSKENNGSFVRVVGPGTPAANAKSLNAGIPDGLLPGDLITAVNAKAIANPLDFERVMETTKPDQEITLEVARVVTADQLEQAGEQAEAGKPTASPQNLKFSVELSEHPLDLVRLAATGGDEEIVGNLSRLSCRVTLSQLGNKSIETGKSAINGLEWIVDAFYDWELSNIDIQQASFKLPLTTKQLNGLGNGPLEIVRTYSLQPKSYLVDMTVAVRNTGDKPQNVAYRLEGPCGVTLEGWWYSTKISPHWFSGASARDVVFNTVREGYDLISGYDLLKKAKQYPGTPDEKIFAYDEDEASRSLKFIGIDAQYFNVAYLPPPASDGLKGFREAAATLVADPAIVPKHKERAADVSFYLDSIVAELPAGAALRQPLQLFAGPKVPELIEPFGLDVTIEYGLFGRVSKLLGWILHTIHDVIGNYALAIICLTIIVRACLFPVSRNAAIQAQRMQEIAPELKKINDKYKDDMEGKLRAQREFQKRVGFNPLAGCLPALLQLPIFIGLYRTLSVDIELRQAAFSPSLQWASNLAGPDMFYYWGDWLMDYFSGRGTGWLGPYFNILPILVVILFLIQQKMFMPPPTDEQQAITQKVMTYMTFLMALFFFRVPAGLCIYFITSSLWGIAERIIVKKTIPQSKVALATSSDTVEGTVTDRKPTEKVSLSDRIRNQINPEPPKALPPSKRKKPPGQK
jgi:YidC/Oxa1 family membrane protein insertase